jgi:hypothetical protein
VTYKGFIKGGINESSDLACRFISALYNHRITSPADVLDMLLVRTLKGEQNSHIIYRLFLHRLQRWFYGKGHPLELVGTLIDESTYRSGCDNPLLRAQLFLTGVTDYEVLPVVGINTITVCHSCLLS